MDILLFSLFVLALVGLTVAWLSHEAINRVLRIELLRKQYLAGFGGIALASFVGFALLVDVADEVVAPDKVAGPYEVVDVIDGDTVRVDIESEEEMVRVIGMDAPETVHPTEAVECFGEEASGYARELLEGESVWLEYDSSQGNRDRYERLLRYITLEDGRNFANAMIEDGYAFEYTFNLPYRYQDEFQASEAEAREQERGLWSEDTCDGERQVELEPVPEGVVKMSNSGICHAPGTTYYQVTLSYTPFESLDECLESGGRLPNR